MKWLWNNGIVLIYWGAAAIAVGFALACFAFVGFGSVFRTLSVGSLVAGVTSILCSLVIFCLRFSAKARPKKVIACAVSAQTVLAISFFALHEQVDFYARLYHSPFGGLLAGGLFFVSMEMAVLLLVIGFVRLVFYRHQS